MEKDFEFTTYDAQIEYLTQNPGAIITHWARAIGLFKFLGLPVDNGRTDRTSIPVDAGCVTIVHNCPKMFPYVKGKPDEELASQIKADERLKDITGSNIEIKHLPIFKEWQEKVDALQ